MNRTCFMSADPAAPNVSKLYDQKVDFGHFWARDDPNIPLPQCDNVSSDSQCSVCLDQLVRVVCRNLTAGVEFFMEGRGGSISFNKTVCPEPPSQMLAPSRHHLPAIISAIICLIFIIIIIIIIIKTNSSRTFSDVASTRTRRRTWGTDRQV
ncbi:uncharacterized protein FYW61_004362 isoform 2-T2 [Anableps anableps]